MSWLQSNHCAGMALKAYTRLLIAGNARALGRATNNYRAPAAGWTTFGVLGAGGTYMSKRHLKVLNRAQTNLKTGSASNKYDEHYKSCGASSTFNCQEEVNKICHDLDTSNAAWTSIAVHLSQEQSCPYGGIAVSQKTASEFWFPENYITFVAGSLRQVYILLCSFNVL